MIKKFVNKIKITLKIMKIKWIKGQCLHMCAWCDYRHECLEHFEI